MIKVLFVCEYNSAKSQIADAFLNRFGSGKFESHSAGLEEGASNPFAEEVMLEEDIDISGYPIDSLNSYHQQEIHFDVIITLSSPENAQSCSLIHSDTQKRDWVFPEPSFITGDQDELLSELRKARDQIKYKVIDFIAEYDQLNHTTAYTEPIEVDTSFLA